MTNAKFWNGFLIGGLLTLPLIGLMYVAHQLADLPFAPFDLFDWIARILPGAVVTFGIDLMIDSLLLLGVAVADTAKAAEQAIALLQFFIIGVIVAGVFFSVMNARKTKPDLTAGLTIGALFGLPLIAISIAFGQSTASPIISILWLALLFSCWGAALGWATGHFVAVSSGVSTIDDTIRHAEQIDRRRFLIVLGASTATITVVSSGIGIMLSQAEQRRLKKALAESMAHRTDASPHAPFPNINDPVMPVPGTRPEYTPLKDHYKVFLRTEPTVIDASTWVLPITGLIDNPLRLSLDDIRHNYESRDQFVTLSCISGRIGTTLISTTQWTGVSLQEVLADAKVGDNARYLSIASGDGFYESVDLDLINSDERIMLCYAWDGNPLPVDHGFPLRIWIPDRFGMKQPKWITSIEVTDTYKKGYWVDRNWDEIAQVTATSVIDSVAVDAVIEKDNQRFVPIGGIAFSGDRGISGVQVRTDGGVWQDAQLRSPLSETTWVIWRFEWPFEDGEHTFEVRCIEENGTPQIEEVRSNRPSGATGIHSRRANL